MKLRSLIAAALAVGSTLSGCTCHSTDTTEVGVLTRKVTFGGLLGKRGVQDEVYAPGATYLFPAFITDWNTFDVSLQNLSMIKNRAKGDRNGEDDISFKTLDGNDIRVDVTVAWQVDPKRASYLLSHVGETTEQVKEKLVRPACRSVVRDALNELQSEEFYVSDKRFQKANEARNRLAAILGPEGVIVNQVILGEHHFHPAYEEVIREKKLAEQNSERLRSEARAAAEEAKSKLERAKGKVSQQLAQASGYLDTVKLQADAAFVKNEKQAEAILAERKAHAAAAQKKNAALAGAGGKTLVKLRLAEALEGKALFFLPSGGKGGVGLQTLNVNDIVRAYVGTQTAKKAAPAAEESNE